MASRLSLLNSEGTVARINGTGVEHAEAALQLSTAQGFPLLEAGARILRGWALAEQGHVEEGIEQLRQGMAAWQATGAVIARPAWLAQLAEAYGQAGQIAEGLATLTTALEITHQHKELWWEAEVQRLRGELLLAQEGKRQRAKVKNQKLPIPDP